MLSHNFDEYFFNRAGFLECGDVEAVLPAAERAFEAASRSPCFTVPEDCGGVTQILMSNGYETFDRMSVMRLVDPGFRTSAELNLASGQAVDAADWATTYSLSFYGDLRAKESVTSIATRVMREPSVTLIEGRSAGRVAGVLAAFRTPGILGVYCVGTLNECRRSGVAGSLLCKAGQIALSEGRDLVLQTIVSDGVSEFYIRGGFKELYSKLLMGKRNPAADKTGSA